MRRIVTLAIALASFATLAASPNPSMYAGMHWRMVGPFRGGRVLAVTGVAGNPSLFYFGAVAGGVWKTNDAGRTWQPIFDGQSIASIGAIAAAPSNPRILYVGTGEADMRSDITYGDGMYKSADAGSTWTRIGLEDTRQIGRIVVDSADPDRVFVAALGHAYGPSTERGVFRSLDGGRTWHKVLYKDQNTGAIDLAIDPHDPQTIFAALWQTRRPPWNVYPPSKGPGTGLYVSHDGGADWTHVTGNGFPAQGLGRMGIAIAPGDSHRVYVIASASKGGLYRSDDGGVHWRLETGDERLWQRGWYFCHVAVDPANENAVYVANTAFYRSNDGGAHFTAIDGSPDGDDYQQLWIDPAQSDRMILGSDQGAAITLNGGATWSSWYNQPTGEFYRIAADRRFPFNVFGAQQDNGAAMSLTQADDLRIRAPDWRPIAAGGESGAIAPDPLNSSVVYGDTITRQDLSSGQIQSIDPTIAYPGPYRQTWTLPLAFSITDPHVLYFSRQVLFRTADGGSSWRIISPDLTRSNPGVPPTLDAPTIADNLGTGPRRGVIYSIAPSPLRSGEIWTGTDDGKIWITRDEGAHWRDVTPARLTAWSKVGIIEASAFDANTAYAAVDRHRLDDLRPYVYRTHDGGKTWTLAANGIPVGAYVNAVREDPMRRGLLYAGTELGVFFSIDDGDHWQSLRLNMPVVPVRDLVIRQNSLAIATHGRSFWVLDDLSPLRQLTADATRADAWLFAPETAVRVHAHSDLTERIHAEEPGGENRPTGALIDYVVNRTATGPLTIEISDSSGASVRRYSSTDRITPIDPSQLDFTPDWAEIQTRPSTSNGMHRFVWDFHYAPLPGEPRSDFGPSEGPLAPPGMYAVRLTWAGRSYSRSLRLIRDPRVASSDADLAAQFTLARQVEKLKVSAVAARAKAIARKLASIAGGPPSPNPENSVGVPATDFTSLFATITALDSLESTIETGDVAPTHDEYAAFAHWKAVFAADEAALRQ